MRVASAALAVTVVSNEQNFQTLRVPLFPFPQMTKNPFGGVKVCGSNPKAPLALARPIDNLFRCRSLLLVPITTINKCWVFCIALLQWTKWLETPDISEYFISPTQLRLFNTAV